MNNRDLADRFSSDVDNLLHEVGLDDQIPASAEYDAMLTLARRLATTNFSKQSKIRYVLRRRLLARIDNTPVTTVEVPGPLSFIKTILKPGQIKQPRFILNKLVPAILAILIILTTIAFISSVKLQVNQEVVSLLAQLLFRQESEFDAINRPGKLVLAWQFRGQGGISSPPAAANGLLYAGSNAGYLYALDAQAGRELWRFKTEGAVNLAPAVTSGALYAASDDGNLYALDSEAGLEKWRFKPNDRFSAGPIVASDTIYVGTESGYLYALDAVTGQERWRFKARNAILSFSTVAGETLYVGSQDRYLYALAVETGRVKWRFKAGDWISTAPIEAAGSVYVGSHDENLYVLDAETGQEKWRYEIGDAVRSSAALAEGVIYFGSYSSYLYALDTETGQEKWRFKMGKQTRSSPIVVDEVVYIGSGDGYLYGVDTQTGQEIARYEADSQIYTAPAALGETIYFVSGKGELYAVRRKPLPLAKEQPETGVDTLAKNEPPSFQFTPSGWYILDKADMIHFRGRMMDGAGNPVNGFSVQAYNGALSILSTPSGPNRWQPQANDGEWEIVIADVKGGAGWWWLTAVRDECVDFETHFDPQCQKFTRISESIKVELVYPDEIAINADWTCHWDCQAFSER